MNSQRNNKNCQTITGFNMLQIPDLDKKLCIKPVSFLLISGYTQYRIKEYPQHFMITSQMIYKSLKEPNQLIDKRTLI